jgi:hypothetical protein
MSALPPYHQHLMSHRFTLLCRFFGLHRVQQRSGKVVYFVVMGNIFPIDKPVHERFDLKARDLAEIQPRYRRDTDEILQGRYRPRAAARRAPS